MSDIKVSICMITKDEEANLEKCLDSILAIINEPWCELIVCDTGSKDRSVEVAKKHGARVIQKKFIPWNFSKARNHVIKQAVGDKIFIIDTDEQVPQEKLYHLKDILFNPKWDEFKTTFLQIRSFYSKDNKKYTDFNQPRIFMRTKEFKYEGKVHNKPKCGQPYLDASHIYLNHYGYKFRHRKGLKEKKTERSLPLLLKDYKRNPHDIHALVHLVKTYRVNKNEKMMMKYGEEFVFEMRKVDFHEGWLGYMEIYCDLIDIYLRSMQLNQALRIKKELEKYTKKMVEVYMLFGSYFAERDADQAVKYYEEGIKMFKQNTDLYDQLGSTSFKMELPKMYLYVAIYYYKRGNLKRAGQNLNDGVYSNEAGHLLRWDIFNCRGLIIDQEGQNGEAPKA